ncbi:MAG: hypothetical protein E7328_03565 [Clostridiales bacterium]|nr:hypothetical protein [Clostridiales bacterium]
MAYLPIIKDQTERALWSIKNVIYCIPQDMWQEEYCAMPLFKHVYHTLHSLDQWFINPEQYTEPPFHKPSLNDLNTVTEDVLTREELLCYCDSVCMKIRNYLNNLTEDDLLAAPEGCPNSRFMLMLAQHRHLNAHLGMLMGFIIAKTGDWPRVMGAREDYPTEEMPLFY